MKNLVEKTKDLESFHQNQILTELLDQVQRLTPEHYYSTTTEVSQVIYQFIHDEKSLTLEEYEKVKNLSVRDIQIILSEHRQET